MKQTGAIISGHLFSPDSPEVAGLGAFEETLPELEWRTVVVGTSLHGERLDHALVAENPEFSRSYLQQLVKAGLVRVNAQAVCKASHRVKAGDSILLELRPTLQSQAFIPQAIPLRIVYQDAHILIVDKDAGMVVHPAPGNWSGTLMNALLAHDPASAQVPRAGIVHRLDKDTSGLMVVARTRVVMDTLVQLIAARRVTRQYLALAHRPWVGHSQRSVDAPIGRDPFNRLRMAVVDLEKLPGKSARTDIELLDNAAAGCLVRCLLHTGRTHQIRVHMASLGHPLVSDAVYGGACVPGMARQALHACRLAFVHPVTGVPLAFESALPQDFSTLLQVWGIRYNPGPPIRTTDGKIEE